MSVAIASRVRGVRPDDRQGKQSLAVVPILGSSAAQPAYETLRQDTFASVQVTEISEGGSVPELKVHNALGVRVFLMDGQELVGAKQNRILNTDVLVGAGQSLSISAQSALVSEHCESEIRLLGEGTVYGVYRLLERLGNAIGPMLAAALVLLIGYRQSFVVIGAGVLGCGLLFLACTRLGRRPQAVPA